MKSKFILASAMLLATTSFAQQWVGTNGTKNVILTDGTGAWCPYCADGIAILEDLVASHPRLIAVGMHNASNGRPDAMENPESEAWNANWIGGPLGYPYGTVDCHYFNIGANQDYKNQVGLSRGSWGTAVTTAEGFTPKYDLVMNHSYDKNTRTITVNLTGKALEALTGDYNFNVWILEDDVTGTSGFNQANSENNTPGHKFQGKGSPMTNFKHKHVLRGMMAGVFGTKAATNPAVNSSVTKTFTYVIPATYSNTDGSSTPDLTKMKLVGLVQKAAVGSPVNNKDMDILNSVEAVFSPWSTGIENTSNFAALEVYPNPASDVLNVRANLNAPANTKISITNSVGQVVYSKEYSSKGSLFGESISLSNMSNGMYFVTVESNGTKTIEKVMVNK